MNGPYDVVIVGSGVAGALIALELGRRGLSVLVLEAGPDLEARRGGRHEALLLGGSWSPEAPYAGTPLDPTQENAPMPSGRSLGREGWKDPARSYLVQQGPLPFAAPYLRVGGGSTLAWLGTCLRLLPSDLRLRSLYGVGRDWPLAYRELVPWYERAEHALGVSASAEDQRYLGVEPGAYAWPMPAIPRSYLDRVLADRLDGVTIDGARLTIRSLPAARNAVPRDGRPACAGSASCVPSCPTRAKYDAATTLEQARATGRVELRFQAVASRLLVGETGGEIAGVEVLDYERRDGPCTGRWIARGSAYVLAANGVESPKLLLASRCPRFPDGLANASGQVGRNLMDHVIHLAWGLSPEPVHPYRGPLVSSGIEELRDGAFRATRAAFRVDVGNDGWQWPIGDPELTVSDLVDGTDRGGLNPERRSLSGPELRHAVRERLSRQLRFAFLLEQLPDPDNRVTLSELATDRLGLPRPAIHYNLDTYTRGGLAAARRAARALFDRLGGTEHTRPEAAPGRVEIEGEPIGFQGVGHLMGTCRMGDDPEDSVVDSNLRTWQHRNLYLAGSSVFPTGGTANATLTIAALSLRLASHLVETMPTHREGSKP